MESLVGIVTAKNEIIKRKLLLDKKKWNKLGQRIFCK